MPRASSESGFFFCCVSVCRGAGGKAVKTGGQSADSIERPWALDPALMTGDAYQASWVKQQSSTKENLITLMKICFYLCWVQLFLSLS